MPAKEVQRKSRGSYSLHATFFARYAGNNGSGTQYLFRNGPMAATSANVRRQGYHEVIVHLSNSKQATFFDKK